MSAATATPAASELPDPLNEGVVVDELTWRDWVDFFEDEPPEPPRGLLVLPAADFKTGCVEPGRLRAGFDDGDWQSIDATGLIPRGGLRGVHFRFAGALVVTSHVSRDVLEWL